METIYYMASVLILLVTVTTVVNARFIHSLIDSQRELSKDNQTLWKNQKELSRLLANQKRTNQEIIGNLSKLQARLQQETEKKPSVLTEINRISKHRADLDRRNQEIQSALRKQGLNGNASNSAGKQ